MPQEKLLAEKVRNRQREALRKNPRVCERRDDVLGDIDSFADREAVARDPSSRPFQEILRKASSQVEFMSAPKWETGIERSKSSGAENAGVASLKPSRACARPKSRTLT